MINAMVSDSMSCGAFSCVAFVKGAMAAMQRLAAQLVGGALTRHARFALRPQHVILWVPCRAAV